MKHTVLIRLIYRVLRFSASGNICKENTRNKSMRIGFKALPYSQKQFKTLMLYLILAEPPSFAQDRNLIEELIICL